MAISNVFSLNTQHTDTRNQEVTHETFLKNMKEICYEKCQFCNISNIKDTRKYRRSKRRKLLKGHQFVCS